ncbi:MULTISPECIES: PH domain-containing protein [unclassified Streptomyces]|uniref:PH domain-containing protein n=1 Tax=unclassified Streptomyces TaxID=2593676 RepID=UPI000DAB9CD9|nr:MULTISPECIES: PH domain-containing protein [unclassified Streptomyces]PZT76111.1 PH domain-containing protein [Streptomyces sp. AC1-42W]PZT79937.1 PH domain-containing protein [Streptomyces sp. AC1-42T]
MSEPGEVIHRVPARNVSWWGTGVCAVAAVLAVLLVRQWPQAPAVVFWLCVVIALMGPIFLYPATARLTAGAYGLRSRTLLRRRSVPWSRVAELRRDIQPGRNHDIHRVSVLLENGRSFRLPLPISGTDLARFDAELEALRALHRRYGSPAPDGEAPVITHRAAGRRPVVTWIVCALLLTASAVAATYVADAAAEQRAWRAAVPCTDATPAGDRRTCLTTFTGVIERTDVNGGRGSSYLYFTGDEPLHRLAVAQDDASAFRSGEKVELVFWHGRPRTVTGERHVWRDHLTGPGEVAVFSAACALGAGYAGSLLLIRRRGRRLRDDELLPSALPFAGAFALTAAWLLPLCALRPTDPPGSPGTVVWAAAGTAGSAVAFVLAWRATRLRAPGETPVVAPDGRDHFLSARFLEHTAYNPNLYGTHVVIGGGPPAVTPHPGPGRFAAHRIPAEHLTVVDVRRARGSDGDLAPRGWHIAEIDDAGEPVRLAAAPGDLARILDALRRERDADGGDPDPAHPR